jgi:hypothetical protein
MERLTIAFCIILIAAFAYAEKWELAIETTDKADLKSGHKRSKAGDVIAYKPAPWGWGQTELKHYTILTVDGLTEMEAFRLTMPLYEYPDGQITQLAGNDVSWVVFGETLAKRRYMIDLVKLQTRIKTVDFTALDDPDTVYQPFLDQGIVLDCKTTADVYDKAVSENIYYGTAPVEEK